MLGRRDAAPPKAPPYARLLNVGVVLADLLVIALAAFVTKESVAAHRAAAEVNARNLARLLETGLSASFDRIDLALQAVVDEHWRLAIADPGDGTALEAFLAREKARTPDLLSLRVAGPDGWIQYNAPPVSVRVSVADREYFVDLRRAPSPGPVISHPYVGRLTRLPVVALARRLEGPDGVFDGVALGTVALAHLDELLSGVDVGPHGVLALRNEDGTPVVTRGGGVPSSDAGRTAAVRAFARYPLAVEVSLAAEDYLAEWRRQTAVVWLQVAGFVALTLGGAAYGTSAWRRRLQYERLLVESTESMRDSEERFRTAFLTSPDSVNLTRIADGTYVAVNEGFVRGTGWTEPEAVGRTALELGIWVDPPTGPGWWRRSSGTGTWRTWRPASSARTGAASWPSCPRAGSP